MHSEDTIVGIATASGAGGVAIVRLSGPRAVALFENVFFSKKRKPPYDCHRLMVGRLVDGTEVLDEVMGVVMYAPNSYTRQDVCELHTHGGHVVAALAVKLLVRLGARPAEAGEFTRLAFVNGRIDLAQAEAVMGIISAQSKAALKAEEQQLSGGQSRFVADIQQQLLRLLSGLEAYLDYPEEIEEKEAIGELFAGLESLKLQLKGAIDKRGARIVREGLRVVLCGRPNAGKSTLFNAFMGEERAIVTKIPGTTRDVLHGSFLLDDICIHLSDTAGLRESADEVERIGVERARAAIQQADVALLLLDASQPISVQECEMLKEPMPCPCAILLNKEDLRCVVELSDIAAVTGHSPILSISAQTGQGMEAVLDYLRCFTAVPQQLLLTHERHMQLAGQTLQKLDQALKTLLDRQPVDLVAMDLHDALYLLGRITGDSVDERLLDDIFSRFCVGK